MKHVKIGVIAALLLSAMLVVYGFYVFREASKPRPLFHDRWGIAAGDVVPRWQLLQPRFVEYSVIMSDPTINQLAIVDVSGVDNGMGLLDFRFSPESATVIVEGHMKTTIEKRPDTLIRVDSDGKSVAIDIKPGAAQEIYLKSTSLTQKQIADIVSQMIERSSSR